MAGIWEIITVFSLNRRVSFYSANQSGTAIPISDLVQEKFPDIRLDKKDDGYEKLLCRLLKDGWEPFSVDISNTMIIHSFRRLSKE